MMLKVKLSLGDVLLAGDVCNVGDNGFNFAILNHERVKAYGGKVTEALLAIGSVHRWVTTDVKPAERKKDEPIYRSKPRVPFQA